MRFDTRTRTTDLLMFNSQNLGALIVDKEPFIRNWDEPGYDIQNIVGAGCVARVFCAPHAQADPLDCLLLRRSSIYKPLDQRHVSARETGCRSPRSLSPTTPRPPTVTTTLTSKRV